MGRVARKVQVFTMAGAPVRMFDSIVQASEVTGIAETTLRKSCTSRGKYSVHNFRYVYEGDTLCLFDADNEVWAPVRDPAVLDEDGQLKYEVSRTGKVRATPGSQGLGRMLRVTDGKVTLQGYVSAPRKMGLSSATVDVGVLVAKAFISNPHNYRFIRYKDGNPSHCVPENIEWIPERHIPAENYSRVVEQYGVNGLITTYPNVQVASQATNVPVEAILNCCRRHSLAGGYAWVFADDERKPDMNKLKNMMHPERRHPVIQYTLDGKFIKEWPSVQAAAVGIWVSMKTISSACSRGGQLSGFLWRYKENI